MKITSLEDLTKAKHHIENEILFMLTDLANESGCRITGIVLTTEEGFGIPTLTITNVNIKIEV